jgi:hypothetical protein
MVHGHPQFIFVFTNFRVSNISWIFLRHVVH